MLILKEKKLYFTQYSAFYLLKKFELSLKTTVVQGLGLLTIQN